MHQVSPRPLGNCAPLDAGVVGGQLLDWRSSVGAVGAGELKQVRAQEGLAMLRATRDGLGLPDERPAALQQRALEQHADPGIGASRALHLCPLVR